MLVRIFFLKILFLILEYDLLERLWHGLGPS